MKVIFRTNLDQYKGDVFPTNFTTPPRKTEKIHVKRHLAEHFRNRKLPTQLEVVDVSWCETLLGECEVVCELWYNKTDLEIAEVNGAKLF